MLFNGHWKIKALMSLVGKITESTPHPTQDKELFYVKYLKIQQNATREKTDSIKITTTC